MAADDKSLRIACRLVCRDQWLVTHVDPTWPVSTLKLFLLHKFAGTASDPDYNPRAIPVSPRKARRRSLSPITFAPPPLRKIQASHPSLSPSAEFSGSEDSGDLDFDDDVNITKAFTDAHRYKYAAARPSTSSVSESAPLPADPRSAHDPHAYVLLTFSTTQILEDRFNLQWYGIHPGELLELHPAALAFVSLPRGTLDAYVAPYFAARVWALRIIGHGADERADGGHEHGRQGLRERREKKKIAVEWKERWAIVHQGVFSLCKERQDTHVAFSSPLSSMLSIRDSAHFNLPLHTSRLRRKSAVAPSSSNVVCVKFRTGARPERPFANDSAVTFDSGVGPQERRDPSTPSLGVSTTISVGNVPASGSASSSAGQGAWWRKSSRDVSGALSIGLTSSASALVGTPLIIGSMSTGNAFGRRGSPAGLDDSEGESGARREKGKGKEKEKEKDEAEDAVWIVLDMLDSSACSHILRILHRHAPHQCHSTFLPSRRESIYSPSPSPIIFSTRSSSPASPTTPGPSSSHTLPLPPSHNSPLPSPLLYPTPTGACSSYIPYKAYHFGGPPSARLASPPLPPPGYPLCVSALVGGGAGVPYPGWRLELVRRARRAGLGAVGRAMELVMFGDEEDEDGGAVADDEGDADAELAIEWARPKRDTLSSFAPSPVVEYSGASWTHGEVEEVSGEDEEGAGSRDRDREGGEGPESSGKEEEEETESQSEQSHTPHWFEDLSYLEDPEVEPAPESEGSEAEWDGWVDAVVSQYRQESLARRTQARREALAASGALDTPVSASGDQAQVWPSRFGRESSESSATAADLEREDENEDESTYDALGTWTWPRKHKHSRTQYQTGKGSDVDVDGSTGDSSDPSGSPTPHAAHGNVRAHRGHGHGHWGGSGRTLSSYSSVDSLLRRTATMRSNIKSMSLGQMKRSSMQALFPSASSSNVHLARTTDDAGGVPSPPPANSSSPSIASTVRAVPAGGAGGNARDRPMSPLSTQVPGASERYSDAGDDGDVEEYRTDGDPADVDDVDELEAHDAAEPYESEFGQGYQPVQHPVPLPGMQIVPSGYTTFQHNSLYGQERWARGEAGRGGAGQRDPTHAGIAHGENIQRLPLPMSMAQMMTTVSSTVSVGPSGRRSGR